MNRNLKILVVEDESEEQKFLKEILGEFDVTVAPEWNKAVAQVREQTYRLVVLDLRLPDSEEKDTLRRLPELVNSSLDPNIQVVVLTAYPNFPSAKTALESEYVYDYIIKPPHIDQLLKTVRDALTGKPRALKLNRFEAIAGLIDKVEHSIPQHSMRVAEMTRAILARLGAEERKIQRAILLAHIHDIGKLGLRDEWDELVSDESIADVQGIDAYLDSMGSDKRQKRFLGLIARLYRMEADLGHYWEKFIASDGQGDPKSIGNQTAAAIAVADAYDVLKFRMADKFSFDDALQKLKKLGFADDLLTTLRQVKSETISDASMEENERC